MTKMELNHKFRIRPCYDSENPKIEFLNIYSTANWECFNNEMKNKFYGHNIYTI